MNIVFNKIQRSVCPHCGCDKIKSIGKNNQHCNGQWNEHIEFECGYKEIYTPNYDAIQLEKECTQYDGYKIKINKRTLAKDRLVQYIVRLDVDKDFKERILRDIDITITYYR